MASQAETATKLRTSLTNYRTVVTLVVAVALGVALLWASNGWGWLVKRESLGIVAAQIGGLLVATGGLAILWELRGKRDLVDEVLAKVGVADDVKETGIFRASMDWRVVPWTALISDSKEIDVHISYGSTWLSNNSSELKSFAQTRRNKMRYLLPDPEDPETMSVLAARYEYTPEMIQGKIREAARTVAALSRDGKADVRIWYRKGAPTFTCYRFDETFVVTLYQHELERTPIPTLMMSGGSFGEFFKKDLTSIVEQGREVPLNEILETQK